MTVWTLDKSLPLWCEVSCVSKAARWELGSAQFGRDKASWCYSGLLRDSQTTQTQTEKWTKQPHWLGSRRGRWHSSAEPKNTENLTVENSPPTFKRIVTVFEVRLDYNLWRIFHQGLVAFEIQEYSANHGTKADILVKSLKFVEPSVTLLSGHFKYCEWIVIVN